MENITLNPAVSKPEAFKELYHFLIEQVLDELGRKKMIRLITNDSTPINVENELMTAITDVFERFEVYDYPETVGYGEIVVTSDWEKENTESLMDKMVELAFQTYPYPVEVKEIDTISNRVEVGYMHKSIVEHELESIDITQLSLSDNYHKINIPEYNTNTLKNRMTMKIMNIVNKFGPTFMSRTCFVEYVRVVYVIQKSVSSKDEFADMKITSADVSKMIMGDLIDKAIELESSSN